MKATENYEGSDWDFEEDLELSSEATAPPPSTAYERSRAIARGLRSGAINALSDRNTVQDIVNRTLPMGYGTGYRSAADIYQTGREIYESATSEMANVADDMKEVISRHMPSIRRVLPTKVADRAERWVGTRRSARRFNEIETEEAAIQNSIADVFANSASSESDDLRALSTYSEARSKERDIASLGILDAIRGSTDRLVKYQDNILINYQRRNLEIQLRLLQVAGKQLDVASDFSLNALASLDTIKEELVKPEVIKLQEHPLTRNNYGERGERERRQGMFGRGINSLNRIRERFGQNARQFVSDMAFNLQSGLRSAADASDAASGMGAMGGDSYNSAGRTAGSFLPGLIAQRFGAGIRSRINQNDRLRLLGNQLQFGSENIQQYIRESANADPYQRDAEGNVILDRKGQPKMKLLSGASRYLQRVMGDDRSGTQLDVDTVENSQQPTPFSRQNSRSINTIIPGLLARIHQSVRAIQTGNDDTPLIQYDIETGQFTDSDTVSSRVVDRIREASGGDNVRDRTFNLIDEIDQDNSLTDEEREALAKKILKDNYNKRLASPDRLSDFEDYLGSMDEETARKVAGLFSKYFEDDVFQDKKTRFSRSFNALSNDVTASRLTFQDRINVGQREELERFGLIRDGQVDVDSLIELFINGSRNLDGGDTFGGASGPFVGPQLPGNGFRSKLNTGGGERLLGRLKNLSADQRDKFLSTLDTAQIQGLYAMDGARDLLNTASSKAKDGFETAAIGAMVAGDKLRDKAIPGDGFSMREFAAGKVMTTANQARMVLRRPMELMGRFGSIFKTPSLPNLGGFAAGMSASEYIPIAIGAQSAALAAQTNEKLSELIDAFKSSNEEPEAGSSEAIRKEREEKKAAEALGKTGDVAKGGLLGGLFGKLFGGKKGEASAADEAEEGGDGDSYYIDASSDGERKDKKGKKGKKGKRGRGVPKGGKGKIPKPAAKPGWFKSAMSKGWGATKAVGRFGMNALKWFAPAALISGIGAAGALATTALTVGKVALTGLAAVAGGIGAIITSPVTLGAMAIAGAGYGLYKGWKWLSREKPTTMNRVRMAQYGLDPNDRSLLNKVLEAETVMARAITYSDDDKPRLIASDFSIQDFLSALDISIEDEDAVERTAHWLEARFGPVYLLHSGIMKKMSNRGLLTYIEEMKPVEQLAYLEATRFRDGPYYETINPFDAEEPLPSGPVEVEEYYLAAKAELEPKAAKDKKNDSELLEAAAPYAGAATAAAAGASVSAATQAAHPGPAGQTGVIHGSSITPQTQSLAMQGAAAGAVPIIVTGTVEGYSSSTPSLITAIDALRFKLYGLKKMNLDQVKSIQLLEEGMTRHLSIDGRGTAGFEGSLEQALLEFGEFFGVNGETSKHAESWSKWFNLRFLPIYLRAVTYVYKETNNHILSEGILSLKPAGVLGLANTLLSTTVPVDNVTTSVWKIPYSPWAKESLNTDYSSIEPNLKAIQDNANKVEIPEEIGRDASSSDTSVGPANTAASESTSGIWHDPYKNTQSSITGLGTFSGSMGGGFGPTGNGPSGPGAAGAMGFQHSGINAGNYTNGDGGLYTDLPAPTGDGSFAAYKDLIAGAAKMSGVDPYLLGNKIAVESSFKTRAAAGTSTAKGLGQFTKPTWDYVVGLYGSKYGIKPGTPPSDPRANVLMTAEYVKHNIRLMKKEMPDRQISETDVYMAHFLGPTGFKNFAKLPPDALAADHMGDAARANQPIFYDDGRKRTAAEIYNMLSDRLRERGAEFGVRFDGVSPPMMTPEQQANSNAITASLGFMSGDPTMSRPEIAQAVNSAYGGRGSAASSIDNGLGGSYSSMASAGSTYQSPPSATGTQTPTYPGMAGQGGPEYSQNGMELKPSYEGQVGIGEVLTLIREESQDYGTFGKLRLPGGMEFHSLELPWRDNKTGVSCIPAGTYEVRYINSPKYGPIYGVQNVKGRSGILIHSGNTAGDKAKGLTSNVEGCILLGMGRGELNGQPSVTGSKTAMEAFTNKMGGRPFTLIISGAGTDAPSMLDGGNIASQGSPANPTPTSQELGAVQGAPTGFTSTNPFDANNVYGKPGGGSGGGYSPTSAIPPASNPMDMASGFNLSRMTDIAEQRSLSEGETDVALRNLAILQEQLVEVRLSNVYLETIRDSVLQLSKQPKPETLSGDKREKGKVKAESDAPPMQKQPPRVNSQVSLASPPKKFTRGY